MADQKRRVPSVTAARPETFTVETEDPQYGSLRFDAVASGPANGELVLLLHGFPQTKRSFRLQLPVLAAAGYRAVAIDQRGYSPQARPMDVQAYHTDHLTADVLRVADALQAERFHLVGHDFGAVVGWQVAARHADRLASYTSLSVGHPIAYVQALADPDGEQRARSGYFDWFVKPETAVELGSYQRMHELYLAAGFAADDADAYAQALGSPEAVGSGLNWYRASGLHQITDLPDVAVPTLLVWSTEDPTLGRRQAQDSAAYMRAPFRFEVIEGADHWLPEHAAEQVNALVLAHLDAYRVTEPR